MNVLGISSNTYNLLATNLDNSYSEISRVHFYCRLQSLSYTKQPQITKTSFKVEKASKSSKEIHEKFPKSTRIRIVINTDELYNSSKFLHGAVSYNCKSK